MWIYVVSMPLDIDTASTLLLQAYFPRTEKPQLLMPRGLTIALLIVAAFHSSYYSVFNKTYP